MNLTGIKSHFVNWREWEFNPIVIKELRQAVRSWAVTGMLMLFLIVLLLASLAFLVTNSFDSDVNLRMGSQLFSTFLVILAGASVFFIPLYVGVRVAAERQDNNPDLLYVSTLSPFRIILGKFLCSAYMAVLFFSACMPFMAFTNLLRGVDLPTVFFILGYVFLVVCAANMVAIFLACLPVSRPFKFIFVIYGIGQSMFVVVPVVAISFEFMQSGIGAMYGRREFWIGVCTTVGVTCAVIGLFFTLAVALISPPSSNRALPVRLFMTVLWILGGVLSLCWVVQTGDADRMLIWVYVTFGLMAFALLIVVSNVDQLSLRVRRTIPQSKIKRPLAWLFFNGAAGGLFWILFIVLGTYFAARGLDRIFGSRGGYINDLQQLFPATAAYAFDYALTALFIHRKFLSRRSSKLAGLLAILLAAGWAFFPAIILFFLNRLSWKSVESLQLGNVFNLFVQHDGRELELHTIFAFGWLAIALLLNARWFSQQLKNFRPVAKVTAENSPPVLG